MILSNRRVKQLVRAIVFLMAIAGFVNAFHANAQSAAGSGVPNSAGTPKMRTRILTSLTGYEIDDYMKRNDVIFVPVGPTELNGGNPTDVEYVIPLAYAIKLAEKSDGLVFPYLAYFYPGSTTISHGTVMVTPEEGVAYLKVITKSLIRQGFRRIIFLTSHGPSGYTVGTLTREIFDETHVSVVWMSTSVIESGGRANHPGQARGAAAARPTTPADMNTAMNGRRAITYGAYLAVGRLDDMPLGFSIPKHEFENDEGVAEMSKRLDPGQSDYGRFYTDPSEHGGWPTAVTAEQRDEMGKQGLAEIEAQVAYVGSFGMNQGLMYDHNYPTTTTNYAASLGQSLCGSSATIVPTTTNAQCRRPYQPLGTLNLMETMFHTDYNGLQISVTQRLAHQFRVSGYYTWSKSLSDVGLEGGTPGGSIQNPNNLRAERSRTGNDLTHQAVFAITWQPQVTTNNRIVRTSITGWELTPLVRLHSGAPFTVANGVEASLDGGSSERANLVAGQPLNGPKTVKQWFNTAAFAQVPVVTGNPQYGSSSPYIVNAPAYHSLDLTLARTIQIHDRMNCQFRAEGSNAFNIVSRSAPGATVGTGTFGVISSANTPRQIQIGGKLNF